MIFLSCELKSIVLFSKLSYGKRTFPRYASTFKNVTDSDIRGIFRQHATDTAPKCLEIMSAPAIFSKPLAHLENGLPFLCSTGSIFSMFQSPYTSF